MTHFQQRTPATSRCRKRRKPADAHLCRVWSVSQPAALWPVGPAKQAIEIRVVASDTGPMNVAVVFDEAFAGRVDGVVWIVDTPSNRRWFAAQVDRPPASAIFSINRASSFDAAVVGIIGDAQEHSPDWTLIEVVGAALSERIELDLADQGRISETEAGFQLHRR